MYEIISSTATPVVWVLGLMVFGAILKLKAQRKSLSILGRIFIITAGLVLYLFSIRAISDRLLYSLESQYRRPNTESLAQLDIIVVLGAGYRPSGEFRDSAEPSGLAYARVYGGVKAFKNSGAGKLVFCEGRRIDAQVSGAEVMKAFAVELGVSEDRIITEDASQNTMQNSTELKKILCSKKHRNIGLVTSALHMPRSERAFRKIFSESAVLPIPVGYLYTPEKEYLKRLIPSARALEISTEALHEWIGMLWYEVRYF